MLNNGFGSFKRERDDRGWKRVIFEKKLNGIASATFILRGAVKRDFSMINDEMKKRKKVATAFFAWRYSRRRRGRNYSFGIKLPGFYVMLRRAKLNFVKFNNIL